MKQDSIFSDENLSPAAYIYENLYQNLNGHIYLIIAQTGHIWFRNMDHAQNLLSHELSRV